ncbi:MAG: hypothetical protein R3B48_28715 [Kofleriaceae bacterium]
MTRERERQLGDAGDLAATRDAPSGLGGRGGLGAGGWLRGGPGPSAARSEAAINEAIARCEQVSARLEQEQAEVQAVAADREQLGVHAETWRQLCARARDEVRDAELAGLGAPQEQTARLTDAVSRAERLLAWQPPRATEAASTRLAAEDALLAALPPEEPMADAHHGMARLEAAALQLLSELSTADTAALQQRLRRGDRSDELVRRFRRFGETRQHRLLERLGSKKRLAAMRVAEASAQAEASAEAERSSTSGPPSDARTSPHGTTASLAPASSAPSAHESPASLALASSAPSAHDAPASLALASSAASTHGASSAAPWSPSQAAPATSHLGATVHTSPTQASTHASATASPSAASKSPATASTSASTTTASATPAPAGPSDEAWVYVKHNEGPILDTLQGHLAAYQPPKQPGLTWAPGGLATALRDALHGALHGEALWTALPDLLFPEDPWAIVDRFRTIDGDVRGRPVGPMAWNQEVGQMLAVHLMTSLRASLARMLPRYQAVHRLNGGPVALEGLVMSRPMDRVTARLLCDPRVLSVTGRAPSGDGDGASASAGREDRGPKAAHGASAARAAATAANGGAAATAQARAGGLEEDDASNARRFAYGLCMAQNWTWLGGVDPKLWNYVRVTEPKHATAEELVAALYGDLEMAANSYIATPLGGGVFRIDPRYAAKLTGHAAPPANAEHDDAALVLADSALADEVATAQAGSLGDRDPLDLGQLHDDLSYNERQLHAALELLTPWHLDETVRPARAWTARYLEHFAALPDARLRKVQKAIAGQRELLFSAVGELRGLVSSQRTEDSPPPEPIARVVRQYALAIGESHLVASSRNQLATARQRAAELPLALLDQAMVSNKQVLRGYHDARDASSRAPDGPGEDFAAQQRRLTALHTKVADGGKAAPGEIELLAAEMEESSLETSALTLATQLGELRDHIVDAGSGFVELCVATLHPKYRSIAPKLGACVTELNQEVLARYREEKANGLAQHPGADAAARAALIFEAVRAAKARQAELVKRYQLGEFVKEVVEKLATQQRWSAIVQTAMVVAAMIGVSVTAGFAGQLAGAAVRGQLLADAAAASATRVAAAQVAGLGATLTVDAGLNALGATALTGESGGDAFLTNFLSAGVLRATLGPLHQMAAQWGVATLEEETMKLWVRGARAGGLALAKGALLTTEMITGAAIAYVVHRARHDGPPPTQETAQDWAIQGASMVIGAWVGRSLQGVQERAVHFVETAPHLAQRYKALRAHAAQVTRTPDRDAAMQLLIERHAFLTEELQLLRAGHFDARLPASTVAALRAGNAHELAGIRAQGMDTMPLRLSGLAAEDASGRVWAGTSEEITVALHQAKQVGLAVEVRAIDAHGEAASAARVWRVTYEHRELELRELPRQGRARPAASSKQVDERVVKQATRYAEAARALRPEVEASTRRLVEAGPDFATELLQIGHGFGGVMNQDTRAPAGAMGDARAQLIVYASDGAMTGRGDLPSGQVPDAQTLPGVRTREHSTAQEAFTTSRQLADATEVGRWEMQTPAYRAQVTRLERRPEAVPSDWTHPDKRLRAQVTGSDGKPRWVYANHVDNVGGLGPADYRSVKAILGDGAGSASSEAEFAKLRASGRLLGGSDPDISSHLQAGEQVLVLGGSATGAWAAEDAARHGAKTTLVGEERPGEAPLAAEARLKELLRQGDARAIQEFLDQRIGATHRGGALRRNQGPGTAYGPLEQRPSNLTVELGVPTRMRLLPDGRVEVTIGVGEANARAAVAAEGHAVQGETATVRIYDRVVVGYGQDPGAPGGAAALLGKGAPREVSGQPLPEVPKETIALRMILESQDGRLVGLESVDGSVRLVGAAASSEALAPWVVASERTAFRAKVIEETTVTHTGAMVSSDSPKTGGVIELQRDKLPLANEVQAARSYRLGEAAGAGETLRLPSGEPQVWRGALERFLTRGMHGGEGRVKAQLVEQGRDGVHTFRVHNGAEEVGLVRVYDSMTAAELDAQVRARVHAAVPTLEAELGRGSLKLGDGKVAELTSHGTEADARQGKTLDTLAREWAAMPEGTAEQRQLKERAFDNSVGAAVKRTAETLAALHKTFAAGESLSATEKELSIARVHAELSSPAVVRALGGEAEVAKVRAALAPIEAGFRAAHVPKTAELGDASAEALRYKDYHRDEAATKAAQQDDPDAEVMMFGKMSAEDVASVAKTLDPTTGKGTGVGAADVADYLASLRSVPELAGKQSTIEAQFLKVYAAKGNASRADTRSAAQWYAAVTAVRRIKAGERSALTLLIEVRK